MDRDFAKPLDVPALARVALMSPAHFSRRFRDAFGETPHRYLQRRRIERACAMLRDSGEPVTRIALAVGFESLGTFSRTFTAVVGRSPSRFRAEAVPLRVPVCFVKSWTRTPAGGKRSFG
ncbi:helix-turn-helix domain-containing protein [Glycomyces amatae]|uniref:helix-turn-helix domain-containing protein n=1 Tax=Glycomyces amatae TaxID=2881355 RepID=UPI003F71FD7A